MTEKLEVDPKVYYQAATNCFDAAAALNDSFKYVFAELNSCGQMAGRDEDGRAWATSYDESARETVSFFDQTFSTLRAYGTALNDLGFEHAKSDAALKGTAQPDRPADAPSTLTFGPYALPASAAGGTPQGLAKTSIEVLDAINCPLPDGNTDTLTKAADAWDRLGTIYQNTNAKDKITISASLFDGVISKDAVQVREDLKTLETSIGALLDTCKQISKTCLDYKQSIEELRNEVKGFIESIIAEAAITVAVTVIATCLTGVGGVIAGAKAVESARRWAEKIKGAVTAWRARKALQLKGLADDTKAAMAKAKQAVEDLRDRLGKKGDDVGGAPKPSIKQELDKALVWKNGSLPVKNGPPHGYLVKRDAHGNITHYSYYDADGIATKRVDITGKPHLDKSTGNYIETPHVVDVQRNVNPHTGEIYARTLNDTVRPALPEEIP
ncbi:polymorphic toxin type 24 domain-containing protein [Nocardia sp. XZ_19_369]|uniref:polymorphic toxin type 24 domain-containing protein n=1 Tax=Nocardia sp. XZ_19_369 TaxID=2769487 RepID=UPI00188F1161|nr:polymorphic toxin type 24 domain-containing protein [Nocardia sp. XZ_19_369]